MRRLPSKKEILEKAIELSSERAIIAGFPDITPEEAELKETGAYQEARISLMTGQEKQARGQQLRYLEEMASELDLKVLAQDLWRQTQRRLTGLRWKLRGLKSPLETLPQVRVTSPKRLRPKTKPVRSSSRVQIPRPSKIPEPRIPKIRPKKVHKKRPKKRARNGKVMRAQIPRLKAGVTSFAYPDHVWKVKPVGGKRKRSKRK